MPLLPSPMNTDFPPLQLKGEIMDLEFSIDQGDHRKRRRNRTTQSCLNCHTSKRKCDRKRPCQRCIQLGLTGLCVYEIDDPALRDDPSVDENTRLRNRIAELESLVRELRGKPHPRWADSNFRDGDPNEKWHSRATKCAPLAKRRHSPEMSPNDGHSSAHAPPALLPPIKTEIPAEGAPSPNLYRFSPSPGPSVRYHNFAPEVRGSSAGSFDGDHHRNPYNTPAPAGSSSAPYHSPTTSYNSGTPGSAPSSYSDGGGHHYPMSGSDDGQYTDHHYSPVGSPAQGFCPCRASPGLAHAYISLTQQLHSTLNAVRQYTHHPPSTSCVLFRRIADLHSLMQGTDPTDPAGPAYDSSTPTDSEVLTPLSASSGHASFHASGSPQQEWGTLASGGYNPYFPIPPGEHGIYTSHVIT